MKDNRKQRLPRPSPDSLERVRLRIRANLAAGSDELPRPERKKEILDLIGIPRVGEVEPRFPETDYERQLGEAIASGNLPPEQENLALDRLLESRRSTMSQAPPTDSPQE